MRKVLLIIILAIAISRVFGQHYIQFHTNSSSDVYELFDSDSIYFNGDHSMMYFSNNGSVLEFTMSEIDSVSFDADISNNVYLDYNEGQVNVVNPLSGNGVDVSVNGAFVTITTTADIKDINYICSGSTSNGNLKIYSDKRFNVLLNNVSIINPVGPAINIQADKKATILSLAGTDNTLTDGQTYNSAPLVGGIEEDQKACLFSEDKLVFAGAGLLTVNGNGSEQHAIRSDDEIIVNGGRIIVTSAVKDGIHAKDGFEMLGGSINLDVDGDGIDAGSGLLNIECGDILVFADGDDVDGLKTDSVIFISGGNIDLSMTGDVSKAINSKQDVHLLGGTITGSVDGGVVLESLGSGFDPSHSSFISCDGSLFCENASLTIETTGEASRGISVDGNVSFESSDISIVSSGNGDTYTNESGEDDAYSGSCLKVDGDLFVSNGQYDFMNSGTGGKGISVDGSISIGNEISEPILNIETTGSSIVISEGGPSGGPGGGPGEDSGEASEAKAITCQGLVAINGGVLTISSADDGIKSVSEINFNGGQVFVNESVEGVEAPIIVVDNCELDINASDDGFNATAGNGGEASDGSLLHIISGNIYLNCTNGDALDSNGDITIDGGVIIVHGPQSDPEVGMDVNGTALVNGGYLIVSGTNSFMTEGFNSASDQASVLFTTNYSISANTLIHLEDESGNDLFTFKPQRQYASILFSSSELTTGSTYYLYTGGNSTGDLSDGLYSNGEYSNGTLETSFTLNGTVMSVNF